MTPGFLYPIGLVQSALDRLLDWTLSWPRDLTLVLLALLTAIAMLGIRRLLVPGETMRRIVRDQQRLRQLLAESEVAAESVRERHRRNRARVAWRRLIAELPAALLSLPLLAAVIPWGEQRLDRLPPQPGQSFTLRLERPGADLKEIVHLVPEEGLRSADGWIRRLRIDGAAGELVPSATWQLQAPRGEYRLNVRTREGMFSHAVRIGGSAPVLAVRAHGLQVRTLLSLPQYLPFGVVGGIVVLGWSPWLCGFLLLLVPAYLGGRRVLRIP